MNTFWKGGIQNLEKEMEAYKLLTQSLGDDSENTDINPEIRVCSDYITVRSKRQKPLTGSILPQASAKKGKIAERGDPGA